jgi:UDP-N-acetylmuramate dehydrogenase
MKHFENLSLAGYNTFGIPAIARDVYIAENTTDVYDFLRNHYTASRKFLILGGGSNVLFLKDFNGIILVIATKGIATEDCGDHVLVTASAGERWETFVDYCVEHGYCGLENLSLIPGCVGASPMQNIGAYGTEVKEVIHSVEAFEIQTGRIRTFQAEECHFAYRSSIFKTSLRGKYLISAVCFHLSKEFKPQLSYSALAAELKNNSQPGIAEVAEAVKRIRRSKLPDPEILGNAGSFFKNPEISEEHYHLLKEAFPEIVAYQQENGVKLAAGWLIEKAGWKGKSIGEAAVHDKQALVLINKGKATGRDIQKLANEIQRSVLQKFGVALEAEVNFVE